MPKLLSGPMEDVPAEVVHPSNMTVEAEFETATKLSQGFGLSTIVFCLDCQGKIAVLQKHNVMFAAVENSAGRRAPDEKNRDRF
jgi:hypothetical protein